MPKLKLPAEDAYLARHLNNISGRARHFHFSHAGQEHCLRFTNPHKTPGTRRSKTRIYIQLSFSDHNALIELPELPGSEFFNTDLKGVNPYDVPEAVQEILIPTLLTPLLESVEKQIHYPLEFEGFSLTKPKTIPKHTLNFELDIHGRDVALPGKLYLNNAGLELLDVLVSKQALTRQRQHGRLLVPTNLVIHEEQMAAQKLQSLRLSDILLFQNPRFFSDNHCELVFAGCDHYAARYKDGRVTLLEKMDDKDPFSDDDLDIEAYLKQLGIDDDDDDDWSFPEDEAKAPANADTKDPLDDEDDLDDDEDEDDLDEDKDDQDTPVNFGNETHEKEAPAETPAPVAAAAPSTTAKSLKAKDPKGASELSPNVRSLPITLSFELGRHVLPLEDIESLQEGFTFELNTSLNEPVSIRANGKVIGRGEVLQIGEQVGVRVTFLK